MGSRHEKPLRCFCRCAACRLRRFGGSAQAALIGDSVSCATSNLSIECSDDTVSVEGLGTEFQFAAETFITADLSNTGVEFIFNRAFAAQPALIITIGDLDFSTGDVLLGFENLSIRPDLSDFDASDISTTFNSFSVDFTGISASADAQAISCDFVTGAAEAEDMGNVPLPRAIWMLGGALFLLGAGRPMSKAD